MVVDKLIVELLFIVLVDSLVIDKNVKDIVEMKHDVVETNITNVFDGVYTECLLHLSYSCLQNKTLCYLIELNKLSEVPVLGDYVKFVKLNTTDADDSRQSDESPDDENPEELSLMIDKTVDLFFNTHVMKFSALGRNLTFSNTDEFVGRKKRKGGGGGESGGGHEDFFKKKMMMMGMMCMKMKFMMMMPAMMGMMGMMSFKGMMFSMMSFMISKMMLLMKLLEKKGGGFGGGGGGDSGWAAGGGGGGAWMPAGGQDYGGGGGGYDANGQWQSRSIIEKDAENIENKPIISYIVPTISYNNKPIEAHNKKLEIIKNNDTNKVKSRKKRGIIDVLQNAYLYWIKSILGDGIKRRFNNYPRYKLVNGIKYVYYPNKKGHKLKTSFLPTNHVIKNNEDFKPIIIADDFNKGETVEGGIESRMNRKKFHKMKDALNDTVEDNPWE